MFLCAGIEYCHNLIILYIHSKSYIAITLSVGLSKKYFVTLFSGTFKKNDFWYGQPLNTHEFECVSTFYAPPTIVEGHYVFWSVRPFSHLSVPPSVSSSRFRLKFLVKVVFDEVEVQSTWNLVYMFPMIWSF